MGATLCHIHTQTKNSWLSTCLEMLLETCQHSQIDVNFSSLLLFCMYETCKNKKLVKTRDGGSFRSIAGSMALLKRQTYELGNRFLQVAPMFKFNMSCQFGKLLHYICHTVIISNGLRSLRSDHINSWLIFKMERKC